MAARLKPRTQYRDVRRTTNAISALDDDQFTAVIFVVYARKRCTVKEFAFIFNEILTAFSSDVD